VKLGVHRRNAGVVVRRRGELRDDLLERVSSLADLERHLAGQGIRLLERDRAGALAITPADNLGVGMQFVE
jgi:hypothetical protein